MRMVLASNNKGKLVELQAILGELGMEVVLQKDLGLNLDVEETADTFEGNALLKARTVMEAAGIPALVDDSGLCVDALDGMPGVYFHRWGNLDTDEERNVYLLNHLKDVPEDKRTARFVSVITCVWSDGTMLSARGTCEDRITREPRGANGFGYDPVFFCDALGKTLAEATAEEKDAVSHRGSALRGFAEVWKQKNALAED